MSRRRLLVALAGWVAATSVPAASAAATAGSTQAELRAFEAVCNALAGTNVSNDALVAQYLTVLKGALERDQLAALLALNDVPADAQHTASLSPALHDVTELAVQLWLSGMTSDGRVVTYADAPIWSTLTFTKPPSYCGGVFGYWADKPA